MEQYISKSVLVAEINRLITELIKDGENTMFEQGRISAFEDILLYINSLKSKFFDNCIQEGDKVIYNEDLDCRVNLSQLKRIAKKEKFMEELL